MSALLTDAIRANMLEEMGYETDVLEFIDMEHTPKNILIRGVKKTKMKAAEKKESLHNMTEALQIQTTLQKQLKMEK